MIGQALIVSCLSHSSLSLYLFVVTRPTIGHMVTSLVTTMVSLVVGYERGSSMVISKGC